MFVKSIIVGLMVLFVASLVNLFLEFPAFKYIYPEENVLSDFQFTDFSFSERNDFNKNEDIVIVNIGNLPRRDIAKLIEIISENKAKVIGINAFFRCKKGLYDTTNCLPLRDSIGVKMLSLAIQKAKNVVLPSEFHMSEYGNEHDYIAYSDSIYSKYSLNGFNRVVSQASDVKDLNVYRRTYSRFKLGETVLNSFALQIVCAYDSSIAKRYTDRKIGRSGYDSEEIYYSGNINYRQQNIKGVFETYDWTDVLNRRFNERAIDGKIVLMGYLGEKITDDVSGNEAFFTPLNKRPLGRSWPDMYEVAIHANITAMMLDGKSIRYSSSTGEFALAYTICLFHLLILLQIHRRSHRWSEILSVGWALVLVSAFIFLRIRLFEIFNLKTGISLTITAIAVTGVTLNMYDNILLPGWKSMPGGKRSPSMGILFVVSIVLLMCVPIFFKTTWSFFHMPYLLLLIVNLILFGVLRADGKKDAKVFLEYAVFQALLFWPLVCIVMDLT